MANMSNDFIRVSRGYADVKTQFNMPVRVYVELWGTLNSSLTLRVFPKAPKGYKIAKIDYPEAFSETPSYVVTHDIRRDYDTNTRVQEMCDQLTMWVDRVAEEPLGVVIISDRLGIRHVGCGSFVSYREVVNYVNEYEMDPIFSHEEIRGYICTLDEAEEAMTLVCQEDTEFDTIDVSSEPLCIKRMYKTSKK